MSDTRRGYRGYLSRADYHDAEYQLAREEEGQDPDLCSPAGRRMAAAASPTPPEKKNV